VILKQGKDIKLRDMKILFLIAAMAFLASCKTHQHLNVTMQKNPLTVQNNPDSIKIKNAAAPDVNH
jgi:uncharacterized lipoprotein YajG